MTRIAEIVAVISTALWLGGLVALFLFVGALFRHDRTVAIQAAPPLFNTFATYQLAIGLAGLIALFFWRSMVGSRLISAMIVLYIISLALAAYVTFSMIPEMEAIRLAGQSGDSPRFKTLHGMSMIFYSSQTIALLIGAMMLPSAISASSAAARTTRGVAPAIDSRGEAADPVAVR
jgi:hypothetical protein